MYKTLGLPLMFCFLTIGPQACSKDSGAGATQSADAAVAMACSSSPKTYCTPTPASKCTGNLCGLVGLPTGEACTNGDTCDLNVDPCPGWIENLGYERTDDYACSCVDGRWACGLCTVGEGECAEGGSSASDASAAE